MGHSSWSSLFSKICFCFTINVSSVLTVILIYCSIRFLHLYLYVGRHYGVISVNYVTLDCLCFQKERLSLWRFLFTSKINVIFTTYFSTSRYMESGFLCEILNGMVYLTYFIISSCKISKTDFVGFVLWIRFHLGFYQE